jgi:hypothetical protein
MNVLSPLTILDINTAVDAEPRILDTRLAEILGFSRPRKIRDIISRNTVALERFGGISPHTGAKIGRGRPEQGFWLNEKQALFLCAKSDAPNAVEVTIQMVEVFHAVISGAGLPAVVDQHEMMAEVAHRTENALARLQDVTTSEVSGVRGYLKTQVLAPLVAHRDYVKERFENLHKRDVGFHHLLHALVQQIGEVLALAKKATDPELFHADQWVKIDGVYRMAGVAEPPQRRSLSPKVRLSLIAFCKETGRRQDAMISPFLGDDSQLYRKSMVPAWLKDRGQALINAHADKHHSRKVIQFPGKTDGEGK